MSNNKSCDALTVEELPLIFSDTTPIPQIDGPVCRIDYKPDFRTAHDYMRAVFQSQEKSERTLRLTALCLQQNPANYTVWHYRRMILFEIGMDLEADLAFAEQLGGANPKNYQLWYHRRAVLEREVLSDVHHNIVKKELQYVGSILQEDGKNYHAWSHRQWLVRSIDSQHIWDQELQYTNNLIQLDMRNNSAWNQRWFVCHMGKLDQKLPLLISKQECDYAMDVAREDPYNESPWRYLIGLVKEHPHPTKTQLAQTYEQSAIDLKDVLIAAERDPDGCVNLNSARIDLLQIMGKHNDAIALCTGMANQYDVIRHKYWNLRIKEMEAEATNK